MEKIVTGHEPGFQNSAPIHGTLTEDALALAFAERYRDDLRF